MGFRLAFDKVSAILGAEDIDIQEVMILVITKFKELEDEQYQIKIEDAFLSWESDDAIT